MTVRHMMYIIVFHNPTTDNIPCYGITSLVPFVHTIPKIGLFRNHNWIQRLGNLLNIINNNNTQRMAEMVSQTKREREEKDGGSSFHDVCVISGLHVCF
mmetsp:Transcript_43462/g.64467  ORF Transcript_43462/g.64467 Transcript_43462/m.64467 type:complete len:99 (+) Transcript_43462:393-689(+)